MTLTRDTVLNKLRELHNWIRAENPNRPVWACRDVRTVDLLKALEPAKRQSLSVILKELEKDGYIDIHRRVARRDMITVFSPEKVAAVQAMNARQAAAEKIEEELRKYIGSLPRATDESHLLIVEVRPATSYSEETYCHVPAPGMDLEIHLSCQDDKTLQLVKQIAETLLNDLQVTA